MRAFETKNLRHCCLVAGSAIALASLLSACGGDNHQISFQSGGMTHVMSDEVGTKKEQFPLPVYPGAKAAGSVQAKGDSDDDSSFMVLSSTDPIENISRYYCDQLEQGGWTIKENSFTPKLLKIDAHKNDLEASVMLCGEDKQTSISLAVSQTPKDPPKQTDQVFTPDKLIPPTD